MLLRGNYAKHKKKSGILLAVSSLPSQHGIGTLGKCAFEFADFLKSTGQSYWQMLPLCPLGKGNSPYSSLSTFAGEILYIDLDLLVENGLLAKEDFRTQNFTKNVDFAAVRRFKLPLLKKAADNFDKNSKEFADFKRKNNYWLKDYCLFMAIKEVHRSSYFYKWESCYKYRLVNALSDFEAQHKKEIEFHEITQYLFYSQYFALKNHCLKNGIKLIGDIPFYVSHNSADVWSNPECFRLGKDLTPVLVAGVPPDVFSKEGQLWGNPVYDWGFQKKNNFIWWKQRLLHYANMYDVIRIDHFRAFADYYTIPYGSKNARAGTWEKGVGISFWNSVKTDLKSTEIIAEDLGGDTAEVKKLIKKSGFPNMKILQFAFNSDLKNKFLPKNFSENCVCYTGTHDNDTTLGWFNAATENEKRLFFKLVPKDKSGSPVFSLISYGMNSKANIVIIPFQDYLQLSSESRMNTPGIEKDNWQWRFTESQLNTALAEEIIRLCKNRN